MSEPDRATPNATVPNASVPEVVVIDGHRVACDGGGGALGHPKVWYELGADDFVECGYCDRRFVRKGSALDSATQ